MKCLFPPIIKHLCLLAILQVSLFQLTLRAATFYVPGDYPTIQEAINIAGPGDEIIVSPGIYYENIAIGGKDIILRSTDPFDPAVVANTIIDGGSNGSVVTFLGIESGACVLAGFTITNGYAPSGAGINGNYTFASIKYNNITGNIAYGSWPEGNGGGLYKCSGIIQNNTISWNYATYGGGLSCCDGHIYNNTISWNSATYGGGLYNCDVSIVSNTISNNSANMGGGLFYCDGAIQYNTITGNYAEEGGGLAECYGNILSNIINANVASYYGGGLRHCDGSILNNIIYKNSALSGGGLHYCNGDIKNNTIWDNVATHRGGGLACCWGNIINCIIYNNLAYTGGDQIDSSSTPAYCCIQDWNGEGTGNISANPCLLNPEYGDFHLREDSPCIDAGCYVAELLCDFEDDVRGFNGSNEPRGDGSDYDIGADEFTHIIIPTPTPTPSPACVIYVPDEKPTIQSAIDAAEDGCEIVVAPGIYFENINLAGKNITLRSTEPTNPAVVASTIINGMEAGPVVTFTGRESVDCVLSGFTITNGLAEYGGGIKGNGCLATIKNNIICENIAEKDGGGIYWCNGLIQNNIIRANQASSSGGGIIWCNGSVLNNTLSGNTATWYGGGMHGCAGTIQNNIISGNNATYGGGVSSCHGTIQNNIIYDNMASSGGGLYYCGGFIQNNTIWNNIAFNQGGGLCECGATIIANCIIYRNQASAGGDQLWISAIPSYSCIQDWSEGGTGNISADPQLHNPEAGNFHLTADSPCIDAGCYIEGLTQDFEGDLRGYDGSSEPRGDGSDYDIGADEYVGILPTPTETPTPTPTETPIPSPTETPTPTPEPTLTPTPTPTPALPYFTFEENEEDWTFSGKIPPFDEAAGNWEGGHLTLNALGSTNCFGYWFSPDVAVEDGKLYRARWAVGSNATDPDKTVGFRLRINQRGSWAGWDRVVNSYLGQAPSAGNPKTYDLYFDPVVTGINDDHLVIFSFDLTSFDTSDDANSSLYLEELIIEKCVDN